MKYSYCNTVSVYISRLKFEIRNFSDLPLHHRIVSYVKNLRKIRTNARKKKYFITFLYDQIIDEDNQERNLVSVALSGIARFAFGLPIIINNQIVSF
jgi:hypothetical protein